jgi:hypothetical protein
MEVSVFRHIASASHRLRLRFFLAVCMVFAIALGIVIGCASTAHADERSAVSVASVAADIGGAPAWAIAACNRAMSREHYDCQGCAKCLKRIARHSGAVGNLQYVNSWNKRHATCGCGRHPGTDWRLCRYCAIRRFLAGAKRPGRRYGKAFVRRGWRATCGRL